MITQPDAPRDDQLQVRASFSPLPYEVDFTGFLSNTVAPRWLERLRLLLIADHFGDQRLFDRPQLSVIARSEIDYLRPVRMGTHLLGQAWIDRCLRASWTIRFTFRDANTDALCLRALQVGAFINPDTFSPSRMPTEIVARTHQQVGDQDDTRSPR